jgi:hypothetical protein
MAAGQYPREWVTRGPIRGELPGFGLIGTRSSVSCAARPGGTWPEDGETIADESPGRNLLAPQEGVAPSYPAEASRTVESRSCRRSRALSCAACRAWRHAGQALARGFDTRAQTEEMLPQSVSWFSDVAPPGSSASDCPPMFGGSCPTSWRPPRLYGCVDRCLPLTPSRSSASVVESSCSSRSWGPSTGRSYRLW